MTERERNSANTLTHFTNTLFIFTHNFHTYTFTHKLMLTHTLTTLFVLIFTETFFHSIYTHFTNTLFTYTHTVHKHTHAHTLAHISTTHFSHTPICFTNTNIRTRNPPPPQHTQCKHRCLLLLTSCLNGLESAV